MKAKVAAMEQPWADGWNALTGSSQASLDWTPNPLETVIRGGDGQNFQIMVDDIHAAYATGLRWKVSGDTAYADKSVEILNAWSSTLTSIQGNSDRFLAAGIYGFQFANAAEIMRTYPGWATADFERFRDMMLNVFYPMNHSFLVDHNGSCISHFWANWDLAQMATMLSIGVLSDREDIYNEAVDYFKAGHGNGALAQAVYHVHPGYLGQWNESARDQGHSTLGIGLMAVFMEMGWNQGDDLYGYDNNRFLAGAEYVARYNLFHEVPYVQYGPSCSPGGHLAPVIAEAGRGHMRPIWESVYNHYVNRKGLAAPYTMDMAAKLRPEGKSTSGDQIGYGTLTFSRDPVPSGAKPSGLTATTMASGTQVMLSWWGSAHATSYNVKRATASGGPYTTIATIGADADTTFTDTTVESGTTYYYAISAVSPSGESESSAEAAATGGVSAHVDLSFDADSGTTAADATGHGWDGTLVNAPSWAAGKHGNAIVLDGVDDHVSLPERVVADLSEFTIATWVYLESASTWARIFDFGLGPMRQMMLTPQTDSGTSRFAITVIGGSGEQAIEGPQALPTGQWVHVAVTLSRSVGTLYVDGVEVGKNDAMVLTPYQLGSSAMPRNWIGRSQYASDPYLKGMVDDFRIYNGALTAAEIAALAQ
ncbi:LamG-like jellyroll fold domain-containing protein [Sorangium sp. So ce1128]